MRASKGPVWAIVSLFVVTALAGCHGLETTNDNTTADTTADDADDGTGDLDENTGDDVGDDTGDDDQGADDDPAGGDDPAAPEVTLSVTGAPGEVAANDPIDLTVDVTGDAADVETAEIAFGTTSTSSVAQDDLTTAMFDGTVAGDPASLTAPGSYDINGWTVENAGTVYFRAHVVVDGAHHWSNEFSITVTAPPAVEEVTGTADHTVDMPEPGILEDFAFDPDTLTIAVGETVQWTNSDTTAHTTTSTDDPVLWDSGNMDPDDTSSVYRFNEAGTYAYECSYHPTADSGGPMVGEIIVE